MKSECSSLSDVMGFYNVYDGNVGYGNSLQKRKRYRIPTVTSVRMMRFSHGTKSELFRTNRAHDSRVAEMIYFTQMSTRTR